MHHDDPNIRPKDFLYAVMHDRSAPIADRVNAASALMEIEPHGPPKPSLTIKIELSQDLEMRVLWESFGPELQKDLLYLQRCYEQGIEGPFEIDQMEIKGRA